MVNGWVNVDIDVDGGGCRKDGIGSGERKGRMDGWMDGRKRKRMRGKMVNGWVNIDIDVKSGGCRNDGIGSGERKGSVYV